MNRPKAASSHPVCCRYVLSYALRLCRTIAPLPLSFHGRTGPCWQAQRRVQRSELLRFEPAAQCPSDTRDKTEIWYVSDRTLGRMPAAKEFTPLNPPLNPRRVRPWTLQGRGNFGI